MLEMYTCNPFSLDQLAIYDSWFEPVLETLPTLVPNGFIYLRAEPDTCFRRMKKRARNEENTVQLSYLQVQSTLR
jgi:deoxyadenosine/deoxycytidine kinase